MYIPPIYYYFSILHTRIISSICVVSFLLMHATVPLLANNDNSITTKYNRFNQVLSLRNFKPGSLLGQASGSGVPVERFYRYDRTILAAAGYYKIDPLLIKSILIIESRLNPKAVSKGHARGIAQFMRDTAKALGIVNCYDPHDSIWGCAALLRRLSDQFNGDPALMAAAYNAGAGAIKRAGWRIPLKKETQAYVPSVLRVWERMNIYHQNNN